MLFNLALPRVIQSIKNVPSGIKIGKEQVNVLAYADYIVLTVNPLTSNDLYIYMSRSEPFK